MDQEQKTEKDAEIPDDRDDDEEVLDDDSRPLAVFEAVRMVERRGGKIYRWVLHTSIDTLYQRFTMKAPIRVAVTGAAGNIGYALVFRLASGEVFGPDQPVILHLVEIPPVLAALDGVEMELDDCAFPTLAGVVKADSDHLEDGFADCSWVLCVGSVPRKAGMERGDLIRINGPIFTSTGQAINNAAAKDVRVLVVGNPCNTNCLIAMNSAPDVPAGRWFAMTMLDQNRAKTQLAQKSGRPVASVKNLAIWGNHSATQFPDVAHATIGGKGAPEEIGDDAWLQGEFLTTVQKRGAAVIEARGASSAASAANAALDTVKAIITPTEGGDCFSAAVCSDGSYGVDEGLIFGYPLTTDGAKWSIKQGLEHDAFAQQKIQATLDELRTERDTVKDLLA